jgi:hypothetical protein
MLNPFVLHECLLFIWRASGSLKFQYVGIGTVSVASKWYES